MFSLHVQHIINNKKSIIVMILMLIVIFTLSPTAFKMVWEGHEQVNADITDFSRGDYDLLVRASQSEIERELGVVEENYLGVGNGGITYEQWENIKKDPRIETAAPVASLGFFTKIDQMYQLPKEEGSNRYTVSYKTTDGVNTYLINQQTAYLFKDNEVVYDYFYPIELMNIFGEFDNANFEIPSSYHPVIAIDPQEEKELTGIDFSILNKNINNVQTFPEESQLIPLIDIAESSTPITTEILIERLDITHQEINDLKQAVDLSPNQSLSDLEYYAELRGEHVEERDEVKEALDTIEETDEQVHIINFFEHLSPFEQEWYMIDDDYNIVMESEYDIDEHGEAGRSSGYLSQNVIYKSLSPKYQKTQNGLSIELLDYEGEIPIHRDLEQVQFQEYDVNGDNSDLLNLFQVDTVTVGEYVDSLAASPMGIYHYQYGHLKETGEQLKPTHHPGSFLSLPANGLISIDWADEFKGEAPIDAIRVKVAGLSGYTEEASQKIQHVAEEIEEMGLHVDIVAGASHQNIDVQVEGIGMVVMPWTTLGAAESIINSWNVFSIVISISFILVALLSFVARIRTMEHELYEEKIRLGLIGWKPSTIQTFYRAQWGIQIVLSVVLSLVILLLSFGIDILMLIGWSITIFIVMIIHASFTVLYKQKNNKTHKPRQSFLIANIYYYRRHIQAASLQLLFSTSVIAFLLTVQQVVSNRISVTDLGQYIHFQINELQIILLLSVVLLTVYTLSESIYRMWKEREEQIEFLKVMGWQNKDIRRSYTKETLSWVSPSVVMGNIIGIIAVVVFFPVNLTVVGINLIVTLSLLFALTIVLKVGLRQILMRGVS
ncbi:FtsX-like permease family protein [Piscibacillus halophilus]|uniref:FtsX-like permease family protein n=1 Tax=Piscibacillus halophilus TaxID=571933 RepID=UPI00240A9C30|nr:FtsX-like permease family protein [Piscibacillus halophilus]